MDWILDLLTQVGITRNYEAISNHETLHITVANTKSLQPAMSPTAVA
jgi:hypothetical protein